MCRDEYNSSTQGGEEQKQEVSRQPQLQRSCLEKSRAGYAALQVSTQTQGPYIPNTSKPEENKKHSRVSHLLWYFASRKAITRCSLQNPPNKITVF